MPGARGATGSAGPRGPSGDAGRTGEPGAAGVRVSCLLCPFFQTLQCDLRFLSFLSLTDNYHQMRIGRC